MGSDWLVRSSRGVQAVLKWCQRFGTKDRFGVNRACVQKGEGLASGCGYNGVSHLVNKARVYSLEVVLNSAEQFMNSLDVVLKSAEKFLKSFEVVLKSAE